MQKNVTIFDKLNHKRICYSVCVSDMTLKAKTEGNSGKDYYIIIETPITNKHKDKMEILGFSKRSSKKVWERTMNEKETNEFKKEKFDLFQRVIQNNHGRVYELRNNSLKKQING